MVTDASIENHGSLYLLCTHTERAADWVDENVQRAREWSGRTVVEPRYIQAIAHGMLTAGMRVKLDGRQIVLSAVQA